MYEIGKVKKKTQDYFEGHILKDGNPVCKVTGNYMGYMNFDNERYYDAREVDRVYYPLKAVGEPSLASDSTKRQDSVILKTGNYDAAQLEKEKIEQL